MTGDSTTRMAWSVGGMIFAAAIMTLIGAFQVIVGIAAIIKGEFFVVGSSYVYSFDTTGWGWIHLVVGLVVLVTGIALFTGATWARYLGIALALLSAVVNFFFLPYYPLWSLVIIALDIFVIWALATVERYAGGRPGGVAGPAAGQRPPPAAGYGSPAAE